MTIPEYNIFVHIMDLPGSAEEAVTENEDGTYSIFIDAQLSPLGREKAYQHAIEHIKNGDFEKENVQEIELDAHNISVFGGAKMEDESNAIRATIRKRRKTSARKWREINERIAFIQENDPDFFMRQGEYNRLFSGI